VVGYHGARSRVRFTIGLEAERIGTVGFGALDDGRWVHHALIRQLLRVAHEGAVAGVAVIQGEAVTALLAVTRNGHAAALAAVALVRHGARVSVVARGRVVLEQAPAKAVA